MSEELLNQVSKEKLVGALMAERKEKEELKAMLLEISSKGKKATEGQLDDLQGLLGTVMAEQVMYKEKLVEYDAEGLEIAGSVERFTATPALLGVIEKFLKNNNILSDISTNENTKTLQEAMSRKKRRSDRLPEGEKIVSLLQQEG